MKRDKLLGLWCTSLTLLFLSGCFSFKQTLERQGMTLPIPSKDEIAIVDGKILTLSTFLSIRAKMKAPSIETACWIGIAGLVLLSEAQVHGKNISSQTALEIARYAVGELDLLPATPLLNEYYGNPPHVPSPAAVRAEIEGHMNRAVILRNSQILSMIY